MLFFWEVIGVLELICNFWVIVGIFDGVLFNRRFYRMYKFFVNKVEDDLCY